MRACTFVGLALGPRDRQVLALLDGREQHGHGGVLLVEQVQHAVQVQVRDQVTAHHQHVRRFLKTNQSQRRKTRQ